MTIDLQKFCGHDNGRYYFSHLFVSNGWKYATDSHICIRVRCDGAADSDDYRIPPAHDLPWLLCECTVNEFPTPEAKIRTESLACPDCKETKETCSHCDGSGEIECGECGTTHTCEKCGGLGGRSYYNPQLCATCKGKRKISKERAIAYDFGKFKLSARNWELIRDLPEIKYHFNGKNIVAFRFDGGEGLVAKYEP